MFGKWVILGLCFTVSEAFAQKNNRMELGQLQTGATVSFVRSKESEWGIEIAGGEAPRMMQAKPARVEIFRSEEDIVALESGYRKIRRTSGTIDAQADIVAGNMVVFHISDHWSINGAVVSVHRTVSVTGNAAGGFNSSVIFSVDTTESWTGLNCLAPGLLYGDAEYDGERSPGGTLNDAAQRFIMREDMLPAPLFALQFSNGSSVAMLDPAPRGESTAEETKLLKEVMTDERFRFGSLGAWQLEKAPVEFGFWFPGKVCLYSRGMNVPAKPKWICRYHPIIQGVSHSYDVSFRFGAHESFRDLTCNTWRWAWNTLRPAVIPIDIEQVRRVLTDHLEAQAVTIEGRTGIPFALSTMDTAKHRQWNWTMSAMGFVGKTIECADQLLREGDRDTSERGRKMRQTGLSIIASMIQALPTVPLQGTGYDLATGKPWDHVWLAPWLRNATEDMRVLMRAYRRERVLGYQHPEWFNWVKMYTDWLILQQREDGSFPRRWKPGSNEVAEATGTTSYCPVPLLIIMTEETGDQEYLQAAIHAADYVWTNWGNKGLFVGGASDNPNITDKEAGMLSMEAFLSLYESTSDPKWLERAQTAGNFAESWIWIWNMPMPLDAEDSQLHWKKGVPITGVQGITALSAGGADEYLDWAVPSYVKLYKYTGDQHYLDVAKILLHNTKAMIAMPGRLYDMKGPGWQQEHWSMGPGAWGRGVGGHRFWLPWVSANHLYGITGLEEFDPDLYRQLTQ
jgi:hypothetical protein